MANIFESLIALSEYEKKAFPFIETQEDRSIIIAIGNP